MQILSTTNPMNVELKRKLLTVVTCGCESCGAGTIASSRCSDDFLEIKHYFCDECWSSLEEDLQHYLNIGI